MGILLFFAFHRRAIETSLPSTTRVVVIDPGHGGIDPGAVGGNGILEKNINLSIALYLREYLEKRGSVVIMTRDEDIGLYSQSGTIRNKKNEDLRNRKTIVKNSKGDLFVSIHLNSFGQSRYYGAQTFYPADNPPGKELAKIMQEELVNTLDKNNQRVPLSNSSIYLIKGLEIPTVLVECGFLSNPNEKLKLNNSEYQKKVAWAIYIAIQRYFLETE
ncbi:N-acetylmuramoyl-L-alanine amidase CwlD [Alkaliphilus serpentinus]|uniref:N-acetylmuramoyl-L-alanine amidase CwlD n=2 Tax=Alkaliphilus serpentinus TaxID=1482731 RepID=A0A833HMU0_9FIRM|nr:N-acetylmuramoyl-L-alanine amidase CwlD [Alkaliphilus serpentinus]